MTREIMMIDRRTGTLEPYGCRRDHDDELGVDIAEIAARDGAAAGDKHLTPIRERETA
jgi:hypothetical protein